MTAHLTPTEWPTEVETTERATYWKAADGTFFATSPITALPPPVSSGGYYCLASLKRLKGEGA